MRQRPRKDANHAEIVAEFQRLGAFVADTSAIGNGMPDIWIGISGVWMPVEIKPDAAPSKSVLTLDQVDWWMKARCNPRVVRTTLQAQETVKVLTQWVEDIRKGRTDAKT